MVAELLALVGARVIGEHRDPALVKRFTVLEGDLTRSAADRRALFAKQCAARLITHIYICTPGTHKLPCGSGDYSELRLQPIRNSAGDLR